jgi:hypothetical protein
VGGGVSPEWTGIGSWTVSYLAFSCKCWEDKALPAHSVTHVVTPCTQTGISGRYLLTHR